LTTRRYSEDQVAQFASNPNAITLQLRLVDRFGDNGIIGVVIALLGQEGDWLIDTWLMSCRVLGRGMEQATLDLLIQAVSKKGAKRLVGQYLPTEKNTMVKNHYLDLGFEPFDSDRSPRWVLNLESKMNFKYPIKLKKGN
jgi:FkbH-like protein